MRAVAYTATSVSGRFLAYISSIMSLTVKKRKDVCYKEYLGPDWTPQWGDDTPHGCVVTNHSSWVDDTIMMSLHPSSFVAKSSVRSLPFVGYMAYSSESLFIQRTNKDAKASMFE